MSYETVTSPTAKIAGLDVRMAVSVAMPRAVLSTPAAARFRPSSAGLRPVATRTMFHLDLALHVVLYEVEHLLAVALLYSVEPGGAANVHAVFPAGTLQAPCPLLHLHC